MLKKITVRGIMLT